MVLKSYAKVNLNLIVNKKLSNGLHNLQSIYCLVDIFDEIFLKKNKNQSIDKISFRGQFSKNIKNSDNSVLKVLKVLRLPTTRKIGVQKIVFDDIDNHNIIIIIL